MSVTDDPAVSVCFVVTVDGIELGSFNTCDGLGCEVVLETREEGGNNSLSWQLPTRLRYSNVKLSRPLTRDTEKVAKWFASMTTGIKRRTAHIEARTADGHVVAQWGLLEVVPVRWSGPSFSPESPKVAVETIEIAHHGYVMGS
ncbi:phage tail protein [Streptomyces cocklensis]|jgi:phage tail-like protein|uniref:Phage tail protein n=1 Tax=Actinacidiphila cocklensis TaxID=887465 RepID=A0A9W4DMI1_9ACTN|nr:MULTISPECIES: phage tail protein [Streptomycetaceae]MDD1059611.1 phage tail protein [Actinacidiphila cocklensis]WSX76375.1 phage tail protein [Streptomyces sp. NBC_00899]CAG6392889.1 Phage tail protein [Actinacidiphila cocklensis]